MSLNVSAKWIIFNFKKTKKMFREQQHPQPPNIIKTQKYSSSVECAQIGKAWPF